MENLTFSVEDIGDGDIKISAIKDGKYIGNVILEKYDVLSTLEELPNDTKYVFQIHSAVHHRYSGMGVGTKLYIEALNIAKDFGYPIVSGGFGDYVSEDAENLHRKLLNIPGIKISNALELRGILFPEEGSYIYDANKIKLISLTDNLNVI